MFTSIPSTVIVQTISQATKNIFILGTTAVAAAFTNKLLRTQADNLISHLNTTIGSIHK